MGLISRQNLHLTYVRVYGAERYGRRRIAQLMENDFLAVDADRTCEGINARARDA